MHLKTIFLANTAKDSLHVRVRHRLILLQWRRWLVPFLCSIPYSCSILWLISGLAWVAGVLLAPLVMGTVLIGLTFWLERLEYRRPRQ